MRAVHRSWLRTLAVGTLALGACSEMEEGGLTPPDPEQQQTGIAGQAVALLNIVQVPTATLRDVERRRLTTVESPAYHVETHLAQITPDAVSLMQPGQAITVQVSPTERYISIADRIDEYVPGELSWVGPLQGTSGTMSFTLTADGQLHGGIADYGTRRGYSLRSVSNRFVAVSRVDPTRLPEDDLSQSSGISPMSHLFCEGAHDGGGILAAGADRRLNTIAAQSTIRLYLLRTDRAHNEAGGGMHGQIISSINTALSNSNVNAEVEFAYSGHIGTYWDETDRTWYEMVSELADPNDGNIDGFHSRRNSKLADVVLLMVGGSTPGTTVGRACDVLANQNTAFAVYHNSAAVTPFMWTAAHEFGHLMGGGHDNGGSPRAYARGHRNVGEGWHTLMHRLADSLCPGCLRMQYFSSPSITHPSTGTPLGTSTRNNRRVVNETRSDVSRFRRPPSVRITGPTVVHPFSICEWDAVPSGGNPPYSNYRWEGVLTGTGPDIFGNVSQSGSLAVIVEDQDGRMASHQIDITVDEDGPLGCHGLTSTTVTLSSGAQ